MGTGLPSQVPAVRFLAVIKTPPARLSAARATTWRLARALAHITVPDESYLTTAIDQRRGPVSSRWPTRRLSMNFTAT